MFRRLAADFPHWALPDHPVLRYVLQRKPGGSRFRRILRIALVVGGVGALIFLWIRLSTTLGSGGPASLHALLYGPLVFVGVVVGLAAMTLTSDVISREKARATWDTLRLTLDGASLTFQARWVAVFYTLRWPLALLILARAVFIVGILIDLAQYFQGQYLDLLLSGVTPEVSTAVGAALLAAAMTAALLQPLVAVGLDAALGLIIAVVVRDPRYNVLVRAFLGIMRMLMAVLALWLGSRAFDIPPAAGATPATSLGGVLFLSLFGDQGLRLLNLDELGLLWADVPYSLLIGLALLALTLVQAWFASRIVAWAARLAEQAE